MLEITTVGALLDYVEKVRQRTINLIRVVPPDSLDWSYMPGKFSIGDQIRHIATIERYLYAETVAGRKSAYRGCGKELADGYDEVLAFFDELHGQSLEIFSRLSDENLKMHLSAGKVEMRVWKWMRLMIEHEIHHRGELYIYLNLLGVKTPPMFGMSAEEVESASYGD